MILTSHVSLCNQKTYIRLHTASLKQCRTQFYGRLYRLPNRGDTTTRSETHTIRLLCSTNQNSFAAIRPTTNFPELKWSTEAQMLLRHPRSLQSYQPTSLIRMCRPRQYASSRRLTRPVQRQMTYSIRNGKLGQFGHRQQTRVWSQTNVGGLPALR